MESCIWPECYSSKLNFIASTGDRKNLFTETSTGNFRDLHLSVCTVKGSKGGSILLNLQKFGNCKYSVPNEGEDIYLNCEMRFIHT